MAYVALYRKLRPKNFQGMVGQEHIIRTLGNQLRSERVSHAYLFCGTRGTGKTSTAKIFAKALNCYNPNDAEPCNECESCAAINSQRSMNVIEIDAASNNGVDNIRDIREDVKYPPTEGKYKVYIIDEVHMLSTGAFNALLKTLEEPPPHIIFILATTEPQKIPATIHSRCQRFDFKRISSGEISDTLMRYMSDENIDVEEDAVRYVARVSGGAMRDAISIMDQCAGFYFGERITLPKVLDLLGAVDGRLLFEFTDALYNHDSRRLLEMIREFSSNGRDVKQFLDDLTGHVRDLLVVSSAGADSLEYPAETLQALAEQGSRIEMETLVYYVNEFSALQNRLRYASNDRLLLEVACIKICNPYIEEDGENIKSRLKKLEEIFDQGVQIAQQPIVPQLSAPAAAPDTRRAAQETEPRRQSQSDPDIIPIRKAWKEFSAGFENPAKVFLTMSEPMRINNGTLYVACDNENNVKHLQEREDIISGSLNNMFNIALKLKFILKEK